jgi:hypothetical protein
MTDPARPAAHGCPFCGGPVPSLPGHPAHACRDCAARTASEDGRPLRFTNESLSGGVVAAYADTGEPYGSRRCWIDGVPCEAREAKFGGIVVRRVG